MLKMHYPERLDAFWFLNAPTIFWALWRVVGPMVRFFFFFVLFFFFQEKKNGNKTTRRDEKNSPHQPKKKK